jgi:hypothetical protein
MAVVYDPVGTSLRLYIDNAWDAASALSVSGTILNGTTAMIRAFTAANQIVAIATVRIYNRPLSLIELQQNYAAGVTAASADTIFTGLTVYRPIG